MRWLSWLDRHDVRARQDHLWFAWHPVRVPHIKGVGMATSIDPHDWTPPIDMVVWLEPVIRHRSGSTWYYRLPGQEK